MIMDGAKLTLAAVAALAAAGAARRGSRSQIDLPLAQRGGLPRVITIADLSCGAGLASRGVIDGLLAHGIEGRVLAAVDPWGPAINSYRANIPEAAQEAIHQTTTEDALERGLVPEVDLVITGPPCIRDSTLTRCRLASLPDRQAELAGIKAAAAEIGANMGRFVVMETVKDNWIGWGRERGLSVTKLSDDKLGGYTIRRRTILHSPDLVRASVDTGVRRGWGDALPHWNHPRYVMLNDADKRSKHNLRVARPPSKPGYQVTGSGTSPGLIYTRQPFRQVHRCTPEEGAALQGFPELALESPRTRERQSLVGNGWPKSFGVWVADSLVLTLQQGASLAR
jgi:site-specific DNA-cytosine methylase